jgi:F0F1-type ATP synthase epsilon subunit
LSQQIEGVRGEIGIFKQKGGMISALMENNLRSEMQMPNQQNDSFY